MKQDRVLKLRTSVNSSDVEVQKTVKTDVSNELGKKCGFATNQGCDLSICDRSTHSIRDLRLEFSLANYLIVHCERFSVSCVHENEKPDLNNAFPLSHLWR